MTYLYIGVRTGNSVVWENRSNYVNWETLTIIDNLTTQVNTCSFQTKRYGSKTFKPQKGNLVRVVKDDKKIFEGTLVRVEERMEGAKMMNYQVECVDYTFEMDGRLVVDSWTEQTVNQIIDDIVARYILPYQLRLRTRFDTDNGATVIDDTKYRNNGNVTNAVWDANGWKKGCYYFNGIDASLDFGNPVPLQFVGDFTVSARVKPETKNDGRNGCVVSRLETWLGKGAFELDIQQDVGAGGEAILRVRRAGGNEVDVVGTTDLRDGKWHHIVGMRKGNNIYLYVDNVLEGSNSANDIEMHNTPDTYIGRRQTGGDPLWYKGWIDEVRIYDRALEVSEIEDDFNDCLEFVQREVNCSQVVQYVAFNYEQISKCFQQLAELFNFDWYVDYDKCIHFFNKTTNLAPFNLTDTNGKYIFKSLVLNDDISQLRNSIYVRGGEYYGLPYLDILTGADGTKYLFNLAYRYRNYSLKVNGEPKTVGIDNLDPPGSHDAYYNYQEKTVRFDPNSIPPADALIEWTGEPAIPVIIRIKDNSSIQKYGERQFKIIDRSIVSKEAARQRARAELEAYTAGITEGKFDTYEDGLKSGQYIKIQSNIRGIDSEYIISRVVITFRNCTDCLYNITLITTRTFGVIEFLQKLLTDKNKEITINPDEVLDVVENVMEGVGIQEQVNKSIQKRIEESIGTDELVRKNPWGIGYIEWAFGIFVPTGNNDPRRPYAWDRDSWFE